MAEDEEEYQEHNEQGDTPEYLLARIEDAAIASGVTTKEKIDEAQKLQEIETEKFKQHIFEYQRYSDLAQVVRHLLGALKQLDKTNRKDRIQYWAKVTKHWETQVAKVLDNKELYDPPLTKQLIDELEANIERLRRLAPADLVMGNMNIVVDDLKYRLHAMYGSLVSLEGIKQYAIEKRHSDMVEYIQQRIKIIEDRKREYEQHRAKTIESDIAYVPLLQERDAIYDELILELKAIIYHDKQNSNAE